MTLKYTYFQHCLIEPIHISDEGIFIFGTQDHAFRRSETPLKKIFTLETILSKQTETVECSLAMEYQICHPCTQLTFAQSTSMNVQSECNLDLIQKIKEWYPGGLPANPSLRKVRKEMVKVHKKWDHCSRTILISLVKAALLPKVYLEAAETYMCSECNKPVPTTTIEDQGSSSETVVSDETLALGVYCKDCQTWLGNSRQWSDHEIGTKHRKNVQKTLSRTRISLWTSSAKGHCIDETRDNTTEVSSLVRCGKLMKDSFGDKLG